MSLKGNLESFLLSSILQLLHNDKKTGSLSLKNGSNEAQIILEAGNIVYAMSPSKAARLGALLVNRGLINLEQLEDCLDEGKQKKQALGKILVDRGLISVDQLKRIIQKQVEEIIYGLFLWDTGEFLFNDIKLDLSGLVVTYLDLTTIILEAARRHDEMSVLKEHIPNARIVFKPTDKVKNKEVVNLDVNELTMLSLVDGKRSVDDLIDETCLGKFDAYNILCSLISSGLIEKEEEKIHDVDYLNILMVYIHFLQIIWRNLEPEIGKEAFVLFNDCKPVTLPGQIDILKHFNSNNSFTAFIYKLEETLGSFKNLRNESLALIDSFNRFVLNILNRIPDILGTLPTQKMLEEIEQVLPNLSRYHADLNIKSDILSDIKKIMDRVVRQIVEKEKRKDKPPSILSMFNKNS